MKKIFWTLVLSCLTMEAQAGILTLGQAQYGGTGCRAGTAQVNLSPGDDAISILFDEYIVEAGNVNGRRIDRKSCNISIPVNVPQGYSVALFQVDYRGFNSIPSGGLNQFNVEYFWAGTRGPRVSRSFNSRDNGNFTVTDNLLASTMVWSRCGESVILRVNSSLSTQTNRNFEQSLGMVDSADISSGLLYHIQTRRCF